ncbi:MFS transporter [Ornithinimicrobium tianjinense]|uniref:MFS transporter n=1 Tax=Ornithinimicrobium tianjinense TaxID=1195761 RepID=A0A917BT86_9MICO|nr:MFS transporter [Ornithinimicrobium tianjinense]GGF58058.1 MFS transporter [Ornithinimicrobium tianjinense]
MPASLRLYQRLVRADRSDQEPDEQRLVGRNGLRYLLAHVLQATGDQVVNTKTVLPWALSAIGAPAATLALLVPVRESGSMLPQAAFSPVLQGSRFRSRYWLWGSVGQAVATAGMAFAVATLSGWVAGVATVLLLAVFALARSLNSLAGKDVLGRITPKGERGQISGISTMLSGLVAVTLGLALRVLGGDVSVAVIAWLLGAAALAWVAAVAVFAGIREPEAEVVPPEEGPGWVRESWELLRYDAPFRRFVMARGLLLVSALSPPFVVALAAQEGESSLRGLGPFVIAQGLAALIGGRWFGRRADASSQRLLTRAGAAASAVVLLFLGLHLLPTTQGAWWLYPVTFLLLSLAHTAVRVGRKTYVVDMAEDDQRTRYVAVSNTAMGVLLLVVGAVSAGLAVLGPVAALVFLAVLGLAGVLVSRSLPEVSKGTA